MEELIKEQKPKVEVLLEQTFLALVENSVGSSMFRNFYAKVDGVEQDITQNGRLSCALYVSAVLKMAGLINKITTTVNGVIREMEATGWQKIEEVRTGAVIVWAQEISTDGSKHKHIGFYLGDNEAVSNDSKTGLISKHHFTFGQTEGGEVKREIEAIYWTDNLHL